MKLKRILTLALALLLFIAALPALDTAALADYSLPYYIEVDITNQIVTIYSTGTNVIVRQMLCSTGLKDATPTGTFYLPEKVDKLEREEWYYFRSYNCYAHYATRIYKNVLFHSIPCSRKSDHSISKSGIEDFGHPASHGCVRLRWQDAEFIAKCCLEGTRVRIYKSKKKDPDLRELLYAASYTNEKGQSYNAYLGIPEEEGVLGRFSEGKEVVNLQTRLRDLGIYNDEINGTYSGSTVNAVREAQRMMGQAETGVATVEFQQTLLDDEAAPTAQNVPLQEGMSGPVVKNMQACLQALKLYDGALDGVFDVDVGEAVRKFQGAYGYPQDGTLSPDVQKALYYEADKVKALFSQSAGYTCEETAGQTLMGVIFSNSGIRLRSKSTSSSDALASLSNGDMLIVLDAEGDYIKVRRGMNQGFVNGRYLKCYAEDIYELKYTATDGDLSYTIGNTEQDYLAGAKIPAEVFADYLASGGSMDDYEGVSTFARVCTDSESVSLNLREGPNTSSTILAELPYGTQVKVLLQSTEWSLVEWEGQNGYLLNRYLEFWEGPDGSDPEAATEEAAPTDGDIAELPAMVMAMDGPSASVYDVDSDDGNILGSLKNGVRLVVVETTNGWSLIRYEGHTGYMKDEDLQFQLTDEVTT